MCVSDKRSHMEANAEVTVAEVMDREYVGVSESDDLVATVELLLEEDASVAVVQRGNECVGVLTERDVCAAVTKGSPAAASVAEAMTDDVVMIEPDTGIETATSRLASGTTGLLVVSDGSGPLGVVTERDLLAARAYRVGESPADATRREAVTAMESEGETNATASDQSICQRCGTLASELASFNGQLLCPDCRSL